MAAFDWILAAPDASNPQEVAETIAKLIESPTGKRPVRTLLPVAIRGFQPLNDLAEQFQRTVLEMFGVPEPSAIRVAGAVAPE